MTAPDDSLKPLSVDQSNRSKSATIQHLVLLDWDDTVMPTTYLLSHFDIYADSKTNKLKAFGLKTGSKEKEDEIRRTLKESGSAALRMLKALYLYFVDNASGRNLIIVTNGEKEWLWHSLTIAGALCPIYRQIEQLLRGQNTEIIYARIQCLNPNHWKMTSFDCILDRFIGQKRCHKINVITIGDQWTDHCSIEMTSVFRRNQSAVSHHSIKLFPAADARYMAVELSYIADLFMVDHHRSGLLRFAVDDDGIIMEFDGYHEEDSPDDLPHDLPQNLPVRCRSYSTETVCTVDSESPGNVIVK